MRDVWFTADTHFGHEKIIKKELSNRPFSSAKEMDECISDNFNSLVKPKDVVYHLGDVAFTSKSPFNKLNGRKHLIKGNHDFNRSVANLNVVWVKDLYQLNLGKDVEGRVAILCHYPIFSWNRKIYGSLHLYGHIHKKIEEAPPFPEAVNVGVDVWDYKPTRLEQIIKLVESRRE